MLKYQGGGGCFPFAKINPRKNFRGRHSQKLIHAKINPRKVYTYIDCGKGFTCVSFSLKNIIQEPCFWWRSNLYDFTIFFRWYFLKLNANVSSIFSLANTGTPIVPQPLWYILILLFLKIQSLVFSDIVHEVRGLKC